MSEYLTTKELAKRLGITSGALRQRLELNPELYPHEITPRGYRYKLADVASMPHGDLRKKRGIKDAGVARRVKAARVVRFGANLAAIQAASDATGISTTMLWGYESGRRGIPEERLATLAQTYGVSVKYLLSGKDE